MKDKIALSVIIILGLLSVSYGMIRDNNIIFIAGIILVAAGYMLIRKKLKDSIREMGDTEN